MSCEYCTYGLLLQTLINLKLTFEEGDLVQNIQNEKLVLLVTEEEGSYFDGIALTIEPLPRFCKGLIKSEFKRYIGYVTLTQES